MSDEMEVNVVENINDDDSSMPWSAFNKYFLFMGDVAVKEGADPNFEAKCKLCPNKILKCSYKSSSNLKTHLKGGKHKLSDEQLKELSVQVDRPQGRKRKLGDGTNSAGKDFFKKRITQADVDEVVENLVINHALPHSLVDAPEFKDAVLLGCPPNLSVCNRKTFRKRLSKHKTVMHGNIEKKLQEVKYVATTADGWSKHGRGFLGMTAHWLDPEPLDRESVALCLKRLKGRHTYDKLAAAVSNTTENYKISPQKITKCTTDSAANFRKAFREFSYTTAEKQAAEARKELENAGADGTDDWDDVEEVNSDSDDDQEEGDPDPVDLDEALTAAELRDVSLPAHQRCAAHIVNLLATKDSKDALDRNAAFRKVYDSAGDKVKSYIRLQGRSDLVAATLKDTFGVKLIKPGETRWNSDFDSKKQIVKLYQEDDEKFNATLDAANLQRLSKTEIRYLQEYTHVMQPLAFALDVLQREKNMFAGYLIPTVLAMERRLKERRAFTDGKPLKHCDVLVRTLLDAIRTPRRFGIYLEDAELELAAVLLPQFKLTWVENAEDKVRLERALLTAASAVCLDSETGVQEAAGGSGRGHRVDQEDLDDEAAAEDDVIQEQEKTEEDNFFGVAYSSQSILDSPRESAAEEVARYLAAPFLKPDIAVKVCYAKGANGKREFPRLAELFMQYTTRRCPLAPP